MLGIDANSFIIISAAFGLLCAFLFFSIRVGFPKNINGLAQWGWGCLLMVAGAVGFTTRGKLPLLFCSYLPNLLIPAGVIFMQYGLRLFGKVASRERFLVALLCIAALALAWVTFIVDDYRARVLVVSGLLTILFAACGTTIHAYHVKRFAEWFTCTIYGATASVMATRFTSVLLHDSTLTPANDNSAVYAIYFTSFPFSLVAMSLGFLMMANRELQSRLELQALHDPMSGAYRRHALLEMMQREIAVACRRDTPLSILMMDLDNFKAINDTHGHLVGDSVIVQFAALATQLLRSQDIIGRFGGEEFVVVLPQTDVKAAFVTAERIRSKIEKSSTAGLPFYTVSIGVACLDKDEADTLSLLDAADKALYAAKRGGKNRVVAMATASATYLRA